MIQFGELAEIKSGKNTIRLDDQERKHLYGISDFNNDFYNMYLSSPTNDIIYHQTLTDSKMVATLISDDNQNKTINQAFAIIKVDYTKIDPYFLCYLLNESQVVHKQYSYLNQGTVIGRLSPQVLKVIKFELPPLNVQKKIGSLYALAIYNKHLKTKQADVELRVILSSIRRFKKF